MQSYLEGGGSEGGPNHLSFFASKGPRLDLKWRTKALFGLRMQSKGCRGRKCEETKLVYQFEQFFRTLLR